MLGRRNAPPNALQQIRGHVNEWEVALALSDGN
jgi:hypothetical protein